LNEERAAGGVQVKVRQPLEQTKFDLTRQLEERDEQLDAARAANRELITQLNIGQR
jgi:hypothetical protein